MPKPSDIATNLQAIIEARGTNASALAKAAGLPHTAASDIIKGKSRNPTMRVLTRLADALGVTVTEITGLPALPQAPGFSEPSVTPWTGSPDLNLTPEIVLRAFGPGLKQPEVFRSSAARPGLGIQAGDILVADLAGRAEPGDTVLATVADLETGSAETQVRQYQPPFVLALDPTAKDPVLRIDLTGAVAIMGVVTAIVRDTTTRKSPE